jgi:hypothetical protein
VNGLNRSTFDKVAFNESGRDARGPSSKLNVPAKAVCFFNCQQSVDRGQLD